MLSIGGAGPSLERLKDPTESLVRQRNPAAVRRSSGVDGRHLLRRQEVRGLTPLAVRRGHQFEQRSRAATSKPGMP